MGPGTGDTARQPVLWNGFANMASLAGHAVTITRGEGAWVFDADGRSYLDALASLWYCNVGHARAELVDAVAHQLATLENYKDRKSTRLNSSHRSLSRMPSSA